MSPFVTAGRMPATVSEDFFLGPPNVAVEVLSPYDRASDVLAKVSDWLESGCRNEARLHPALPLASVSLPRPSRPCPANREFVNAFVFIFARVRLGQQDAVDFIDWNETSDGDRYGGLILGRNQFFPNKLVIALVRFDVRPMLQ
jgi:hypothetical protein